MKEFRLSIPITVRVGDINYGNHVGYQHYFLYFQEARILYLRRLGFSEMDIGGYGMIISAAECRYKLELRLGDEIRVQCRVDQVRSKLFTMDYRITLGEKTCALGTTTNHCFDYNKRHVVSLPETFVKAVREFEGTE